MKTEENIVTFINNLEAENQDIECKKIFWSNYVMRLQKDLLVKIYFSLLNNLEIKILPEICFKQHKNYFRYY